MPSLGAWNLVTLNFVLEILSTILPTPWKSTLWMKTAVPSYINFDDDFQSLHASLYDLPPSINIKSIFDRYFTASGKVCNVLPLKSLYLHLSDSSFPSILSLL